MNELCGILLVDKHEGLTSHDVVARVRRSLGTRRVGHAGTLDPMATGVLVVLVGQATKLAPFLTADDKAYSADIELGRETSSYDRDGDVLATRPVPEAVLTELRAIAAGSVLSGDAQVRAAIASEIARTSQTPPSVSAVHVDGQRSYARARAGETFVIPPRPVAVRRLELVGATVEPPTLSIELDVSKGYYVRALARDVGAFLGIGAHLTRLRRLRSGVFDITETVGLDGDLRGSLLDLGNTAARALPVATLTSAGTARARQGKEMRSEDFLAAPPDTTAAWMTEDHELVAIGGRSETDTEAPRFKVLRGFQQLAGVGAPVAPINPGR